MKYLYFFDKKTICKDQKTKYRFADDCQIRTKGFSRIYSRSQCQHDWGHGSTSIVQVGLLISTIETIEKQELAKSNVNLNISFEERTPELYDKIRRLNTRFSKSFKRLIFTIHPYNLPGEISGKCSNTNYGIRESMAQLYYLGIDTDNLMMCDSDTKFHPEFLNALGEKYCEEDKSHESVF